MSLLVLFGATEGESGPGTPGGVVYPELALLYTPIRDEIARMLRARTTGPRRGGEIGEFTEGTNPTLSEVDNLINDAAALVHAHIGGQVVTEVLWPVGRRVVSLGTVLLIEAGSEQVNQVRYDRFKTLYDEALAALKSAMPGPQPGEDSDTANDASPLWCFPPACGLPPGA